MRARHWVGIGALVCWGSACGGKAATSSAASGGAGSAPRVETGGGATEVPSAGAAAVGRAGSGTGGVSAVASADDGGAGGEAGYFGCTEKLATVSKVLDLECPAEVCAGTVIASNCGALPDSVVRTSEAFCDHSGLYDRVLSLTFELSGGRRKACYYQRENYDKLALLVGAEAWDNTESFCAGTDTHVRVGTAPEACERARSTTLCDLQNPANGAPVDPNVAPRGCFDGFSSSCEPCCDGTEDKKVDCTGKPDGFPGYECTPHPDDHYGPSYCSCSCQSEGWECAC